VDGYRTAITEERTTYFYHTDHLGSTVLVTDKTGATVWSTEYTPFGSLTFEEGKLKRAVKFTGKDLDEDTGLYYFNARWYDQSIGRFISEDPIKDGMNWYTYAANNPLVFYDSTGLFAEQVDVVITPSAEMYKIGTLGIVEKTDSLDSLAEDFYGDPAKKELISIANNLDPENPVIRPGQVLYVPDIQEVYDDKDSLIGYSFVDIAKGREDIGLYLEYKHKEAINRKGSWNYRYAHFGIVTGNAEKDVAGNLAVAGAIFMGQQAAVGGTVYASAQKLYFNLSVKAYIAGQNVWSSVKDFLHRKKAGFFERLFNRKLPIDKIKANPLDDFSDPKVGPSFERLRQHRDYIHQHGTIIKPIDVIKLEGGYYQIVDGHHRWLAAKQAGLKIISVRVIR